MEQFKKRNSVVLSAGYLIYPREAHIIWKGGFDCSSFIRFGIDSNDFNNAQSAIRDVSTMLVGVSFKKPNLTLEQLIKNAKLIHRTLDLIRDSKELRRIGLEGRIKAEVEESRIIEAVERDSVIPEVKIREYVPENGKNEKCLYVEISCDGYSRGEYSRVINILRQIAETVGNKYETPFEDI